MPWQPLERPLINAAYALNLAVRMRRQLVGHRHHAGNAEAIIAACIDDCWNGTYYRASAGHFRQFWTRDLCFSAVALARLGAVHRTRALRSIGWAIRTWRRQGMHITTTIHFFDQPVDVFDYGVDCLPLLLAALERLRGGHLLRTHRSWLEGEVSHFVDHVVDPRTGLVRADRKYSAHRDTMVNRCNAYGNSMVALLAKTLASLDWPMPSVLEPLARDPADLLIRTFWNERGGYFVDEPGDERPSGEGNVWPFWTGVVADPSVLRSALATLEARGFAEPYPLKYEVTRRPELEPPFVRTFMADYQGATVWTSLGSMYLQLLRTLDPEQAHREVDRYRSWIERDGTFWEVIDDETGRAYSSTFLTHSDESMLWSSIFLDLLEHPEARPAILS